MIQHDWLLERLAQEHRTELMRHSENERLLRTDHASAQQHGHAWYHVLNWAGGQLIHWGERLQARHALYHQHTLNHPLEG